MRPNPNSFTSGSVEWYSAGQAGAGSYAPPPPSGGVGGGGGGGAYGGGGGGAFGYGGGGGGGAYGAPGGGGGYAAAGAGGGFDDEPPLLEELGIDLSAIARKSAAVLAHRLRAPALDDGLDMGGALLWALALAALHLLAGKMHFGVVLGWGVLQSVAVWFVAHQLRGGSAVNGGGGSADGGGAGGGGGGFGGQHQQQQHQQHQQPPHQQQASGLDLYSVCCVTGYCMLPVLMLSAAALLVPRGPLTAAAAVLAAAWAGHLAARVVAAAPGARGTALARSPALLAYPCFLMYGAFALLTVY